MSKTTKKDIPEKPSLSSADGSGAHPSVTTDDLSLVITHMKKSNGFVKETTKELINMNKGQANQNKWLRVLAVLLSLLIAVLGYVVHMQRQQLGVARSLVSQLKQTNERLDDVVEEQKKTKTAAEDTKKAIDEQPTITVKPADTTDPTSRPTLVVVPKVKKRPKPKGHKKGDSPPKPAAKPSTLEFPLGPPKKKSKE